MKKIILTVLLAAAAVSLSAATRTPAAPRTNTAAAQPGNALAGHAFGLNPIYTFLNVGNGIFQLNPTWEMRLQGPWTLMAEGMIGFGGSNGASTFLIGAAGSARYYFFTELFTQPAKPLEGLFAQAGLLTLFNSTTVDVPSFDPVTFQQTTSKSTTSAFSLGAVTAVGYKYVFGNNSGFFVEPLLGFSLLYTGVSTSVAGATGSGGFGAGFYGGTVIGWAF